MNKLLSVLLSLAVATSMLAACGGNGGNEGVQVAPPVAVIPASPTSVAAVVNTTYAFPTGVPSFGTTSTTTVVFTSTATTPAFSISSGGKTATGTTTFGSCHFKITQSDFVAPSPLAAGNTIIVNPCNISVDTNGQASTGTNQVQPSNFVLGTASSTDVPVVVSVDSSGNINVNGSFLGTVPLVPLTGG
jgi:hypothetical protein